MKRLYITRADDNLVGLLSESGYVVTAGNFRTFEDIADEVIGSDVFVLDHEAADQTDWIAFGYALALGEELVVVNCSDESYVTIPDVRVFSTVSEFLEVA